ncbi:putative pyroglutamyl peptidase type I [Xylariales sp. PMI_506]|nr:putative pyroglutamyl peptidase type I [Xylariales sp. PMI_506]
MGSLDVQHEDELTVLVTGFGPFKDDYPVNPSWAIASSLPEYLPWDRVKDPGHKSSSKVPRVRLVVHPEPIRVSYDVVRKLVPSFWDTPGQKFDLAVHLGMAGPPIVYSVERRAHRDGYRHKDVDGNLLGDEKRHEEQGDDWIWHGVPDEILSDLDIDDIYKRWVGRSPIKENATLRISEDPGRYLCDFIYFSSLAHLWKQNRARKVVFFHVPATNGQEHVETGTELLLQLIRSIVESEVQRKTAASPSSGKI